MTERLDGRGEEALARELRRCAAAVFGSDIDAVEPGEILDAMLGIAARLGEEVTRRLDRIPEKQAANFHAAMGADRAPPVPARVPVAIRLLATAPEGLLAPARTRLQATTDADPITFETRHGMTLLRGSVPRICAADLAGDRVFVAPPAVAAPTLPRTAPVRRVLASAAGPGATKLQVEPATDLEAGMIISFGDPSLEADHEITGVEGNLVTVTPPVATTVPEGGGVREVTQFSPWEAGARDRQSHRLYLGHSTLLDLPSATRIAVSGLADDRADIDWAWFGKLTDSDPRADWHPFTAARLDAGSWVFDKPKGKIEKTGVEGRETRWLRATLRGPSTAPQAAQSIRIAAGACDLDASDVGAGPGADYEAVAVTTPVVSGTPFHPFGHEPRIYDGFYVGCSEAFGKAGAKARLDFTLGGAVLGPMAAVTTANLVQFFAVGTDGLLYRVRLDQSDPRFGLLPLPVDLDRTGFPGQAAVAAAQTLDGRIALGVAGRGCVWTTVVDVDPGTAPGSPVWRRLAGDADAAQLVFGSIQLVGDPLETVLAFCDGRLFTWSRDTSTPQPRVEEAVDLLPILNAYGRASVIVRAGAHGDLEVTVRLVGLGTTPPVTVPAGQLPERMRAAWADGPFVYIAGFAADADPAAPAELELVRLSPAAGTFQRAPHDLGLHAPRPIGFEPPYAPADDWPVLVLATPVPTRVTLRGGAVATIASEANIGASINAARRLVSIDGWTVVQHPDRGVLYRRNAADLPGTVGEHSIASARLDGRYVPATIAGELPAGAEWLVFRGASDGAAYRVVAHAVTGDSLLFPTAAATPPSPGPVQFPANPAVPLRRTGGTANTLDIHGVGAPLTLRNFYDPAARSIRLLIEHEGSQWIWRLSRNSKSDRWTAPAGFDPRSDPSTVYTALGTIAGQNGQAVSRVLGPGNTRPYFAAPSTDVAALRKIGAVRALLAGGSAGGLDQTMADGADDVFPVRAELIEDRVGDAASVRMAQLPAPWSLLGPNQPANPDLSWEYWNGSSWWALDATALTDSTADLLVSGKVGFTVPRDMAETDVGGRRNRWIRARLIGGDYGEARVTVTSVKVDTDTTKQSVSRDLGAIRAPYVIDLTLRYCTQDALAPEVVLAADTLGVIDQTNANLAGLPVRFFLPVSAALDPGAPPAAATSAGTGACCERWDDGPSAPAAGPAAPEPLPARVVLLALDQVPKGDVVSIYLDAEPTGRPAELAARAFRAGAFAALEIVDDASFGLSEPGALRLRIAEPPDRSELLGLSAFWLALAPAADAGDWSPRLRGVHLNGVVAESVETRRNEPVGSSSGAPDQTFALATRPIDPDSLALWIREPLGQREADTLGAEAAIEGMPGPWVQWRQKPELPVAGAGAPQRLFTVNALTGELRFGDGRTALVPPPGSAVLARTYAHVVGDAANGVAAGAELQPISPIAGIDKVRALDVAGGGADAESTGQALARAPVKLLNGDHPVTLADLEEFVTSRLPRVAQAHAENRRGRARLVVAERGAAIVPAPATLREILADVAAAAAYGAATRLEVVGPRLLPIRVEIALEPDRGVDAATAFAEARATVRALVDHETGGHDGRGWPVGARPEPADVAAALADLAERAAIRRIAILRAGSRAPLPDPLPSDVLVTASEAEVVVAPAGEAAG